MVDLKILTMRQRMLDGQPFRTDDSGLARDRSMAQARETAFNEADQAADPASLLAELATVGEGTRVRAPLHVEHGRRIAIGSGCEIAAGLVAQDFAEITIGNDVLIGANVQLLTLTRPVQAEQRRAKWAAASPVRIGDNVSLGAGVIVSPGVRIGDNTVVGAGSVVIGDLPAGVVAVGNPAKVIGTVS
ncbi:DapH/DapD/GlmU-related protein [Nocardioides dubius]|uniref:Acetyltransferase n=1 Tax=Nocardioides dubius TaxID=317019 RepID=A0ABP4EH68_9ACTN